MATAKPTRTWRQWIAEQTGLGPQAGPAEPSWLVRQARALAAIDPRSLAALRVALGAILLWDTADRLRDLHSMYAGDGMFPIELVMEATRSPFRWSLHFLSGAWWWQATLFALAGVFAFLLMIGCGTRVATVASWVLAASVQARAPCLLNGGDTLLKLLLFWGALLPLGRVWSVDARLRRWWNGPSADLANAPALTTSPALATAPARPAAAFAPYLSFAGLGLLLQMALVYHLSGWCKFNVDWQTGKSIRHTLQYDTYGRPLVDWLPEADWFYTGMAWGTVGLELVGPLLLFLPLVTQRARLVMVPCFWMLHLGIELTLTVGLFSYVSSAGLIAFLPPLFWDYVGRDRRRRSASRSAASPPAAAAVGSPEVAAPAVAAPARAGPAPAWRRARWAGRAAVEGAALFFIGLVVLWNVALNLPDPWSKFLRPNPVRHVAEISQTMQGWNMFNRAPAANEWFVAKATLRDGSEVDLLRGGAPVSEERPHRIARLYPNHRWRKMIYVLTEVDKKSATKERENQKFRDHFADYLARDWNARHDGPRQVIELEITRYHQEIRPTRAERAAVVTSRFSKRRFTTEPPKGNFAKALEALEAGEPPPP